MVGELVFIFQGNGFEGFNSQLIDELVKILTNTLVQYPAQVIGVNVDLSGKTPQGKIGIKVGFIA